MSKLAVHLVAKMEFRGILVVLAAIAVAAKSAELATFPEIAREFASSRIVSGWEADEGQFPHQLSLRMVSAEGAVSSCGGSVIHSDWGLTAAHCTASRISFVIRLGGANLTRPHTIFETTEFYNYPLYDNSRPSVVQPHDIGLLKFGRTVQFNDYIKPIRLQRDEAKNRDYEGTRLTASGWGRTWTNGASPENLNWVFLLGDTNFRCWMMYGGIIVDSTICASGYNDTTQSTCQGDSGGPLTVIDDDGEVSIVGVTSFVSGAGCHAGFPAGFIRPGHYHAWFTEVTGIDFDWVSTVTPTPEPEETPEVTEISTTEGPQETNPTEVTETSSTEGPQETNPSVVPGLSTTAPEEFPSIAPEWWYQAGDEDVKVHFVNN